MSRRAAAFSQADVTRASRGALKAGLPVRRVEIDAAGKIVVICSDDAPERSLPVPVAQSNDWRL
jgi:hypothetical protein